MYGDAPVDWPPQTLKPRCQGFIVSTYVNSDHAGETITSRPITGFFIYCNNALVYWMSKKQESIEISSLGSEFFSHESLHLIHSRTKIQAPDDGDPIRLPCIHIWIQPIFISQYNHAPLDYITYHFIREANDCNKWRATYINTNYNQSDLLTKPLPHGEKRTKFCRMILYHIWVWRATRTY